MRLSIVCGEYHRIIKDYLPTSSTNVAMKIDIEKILPAIVKSTRPYFLASTSVLMLVYLIMAFLSPMSCTHYLGFTLVLCIFIDYLTHCTFFSACLVITLQRIQSRRHCLLCHHLPTDYSPRNDEKSLKTALCKKPKAFWSSVNSTPKKLAAGFVCLLSVVFLGLSVASIFRIDTHLFEDRFLPKDATTLRSYMRSHLEQYDIGPVIMFVIPQPIDYKKKENQALIHRLTQRCLNDTHTNEFKLLWLDYENIPTILTSRDPLYLRITPYSQNDIIVSEANNRSVINATRFYCQLSSTTGT